jgi:asparagine synthetase B (glutamine-hydrolysing)
MFAFALYDAHREELLLARDRIGIKPLYYAQVAGGLLFGSEIKALLAHPALGASIDFEAFLHYLTFVSTPAPLTLFAGIRKLRPGTLLRVDRRGGIREEVYWDAIVPGRLEAAREEEVCAEILRLLQESVRKRMMFGRSVRRLPVGRDRLLRERGPHGEADGQAPSPPSRSASKDSPPTTSWKRRGGSRDASAASITRW